MKRSCLAAAIYLTSVPAFAEPAPVDRAAAKLFATTCLKYPDNPARLKVLLDTHFTPALDKSEQFFLGMRTGKVWLAHQSEGNFAVLVLDDGRCAVDAETASAEGAMAALEAEAPAAGYKISTVKDEPKGRFHGVEGHVRTYKLEALGRDYPVKVAGTALPAALLHAELMLETSQ